MTERSDPVSGFPKDLHADPARDINVLKDHSHNFVVIIKDGANYKNTIS
jgi:hypothetical protein